MTVNELIEKLKEFDGDLEVMLVEQNNGNLLYISEVEQETKRDPYDQDWDTQVVVIRN